jgi:hypothetical protein
MNIFKPLLMFLTAFLIPVAVINIFLNNNTIGMATKQIVILFIVYSFYHNVFKHNNYNHEKLFKIYLNLAFVISIIGIIQSFSYIINFKYGYDLSYFIPYWGPTYLKSGFVRMHSILTEPAQYGVAMMPAFFIGLYNIITLKNKFISLFKSVVLVFSMLLTFSLVAYIGVIFSTMLLSFRKGINIKAFTIFLVVIFAIIHSYNNVPEIRMRINDTYNAFVYSDTESINLSSFAIYNNAIVAVRNISEHVIFGTGIGSHPVIFDRYSLFNYEGNLLFNDVNKGEAASMFLRVMSETGMLGILIVVGFIIKCYVGFNRNTLTTKYSLISQAVLSLFFIKLLRSGHYFNTGLPFFVLIYYYNYSNYKASFKGASRKQAFQKQCNAKTIKNS